MNKRKGQEGQYKGKDIKPRRSPGGNMVSDEQRQEAQRSDVPAKNPQHAPNDLRKRLTKDVKAGKRLP